MRQSRFLKELIREMDGVDVVVINAGVWLHNPDLAWDYRKNTIDINVTGICGDCDSGISIFCGEGKRTYCRDFFGCSAAGFCFAPAYNASKAFELNYLEGFAFSAHRLHLPIIITTIQPGYVATPLIADSNRIFWVASVETAAKQIYNAIRH